MGPVFTTFLFQMSFATTATTIVSGAMAERCNFNAYCLFSLVNTVVYCLPAHWLWHSSGLLKRMGVVDIAGSGGVHLVTVLRKCSRTPIFSKVSFQQQTTFTIS